jgi:membrane protein implicated in regulation of membrane protease activity
MHAEVRALWSIFWRSIVWFPIGLLKLAFILIAPAIILTPFIAAVTYGIVFASVGFWWEAIACVGLLAGLILLAHRFGRKRIIRNVAAAVDSLSPRSPF